MNSKNLSKAINRVLAILLTAAMVAGSFTVPAKASDVIEPAETESVNGAEEVAENLDDVAEDVAEEETSGKQDVAEEAVPEETTEEVEEKTEASAVEPEITEEEKVDADKAATAIRLDLGITEAKLKKMNKVYDAVPVKVADIFGASKADVKVYDQSGEELPITPTFTYWAKAEEGWTELTEGNINGATAASPSNGIVDANKYKIDVEVYDAVSGLSASETVDFEITKRSVTGWVLGPGNTKTGAEKDKYTDAMGTFAVTFATVAGKSGTEYATITGAAPVYTVAKTGVYKEEGKPDADIYSALPVDESEISSIAYTAPANGLHAGAGNGSLKDLLDAFAAQGTAITSANAKFTLKNNEKISSNNLFNATTLDAAKNWTDDDVRPYVEVEITNMTNFEGTFKAPFEIGKTTNTIAAPAAASLTKKIDLPGTAATTEVELDINELIPCQATDKTKIITNSKGVTEPLIIDNVTYSFSDTDFFYYDVEDNSKLADFEIVGKGTDSAKIKFKVMSKARGIGTLTLTVATKNYTDTNLASLAVKINLVNGTNTEVGPGTGSIALQAGETAKSIYDGSTKPSLQIAVTDTNGQGAKSSGQFTTADEITLRAYYYKVVDGKETFIKAAPTITNDTNTFEYDSTNGVGKVTVECPEVLEPGKYAVNIIYDSACTVSANTVKTNASKKFYFEVEKNTGGAFTVGRKSASDFASNKNIKLVPGGAKLTKADLTVGIDATGAPTTAKAVSDLNTVITALGDDLDTNVKIEPLGPTDKTFSVASKIAEIVADETIDIDWSGASNDAAKLQIIKNNREKFTKYLVPDIVATDLDTNATKLPIFIGQPYAKISIGGAKDTTRFADVDPIYVVYDVVGGTATEASAYATEKTKTVAAGAGKVEFSLEHAYTIGGTGTEADPYIYADELIEKYTAVASAGSANSKVYTFTPSPTNKFSFTIEDESGIADYLAGKSVVYTLTPVFKEGCGYSAGNLTLTANYKKAGIVSLSIADSVKTSGKIVFKNSAAVATSNITAVLKDEDGNNLDTAAGSFGTAVFYRLRDEIDPDMEPVATVKYEYDGEVYTKTTDGKALNANAITVKDVGNYIAVVKYTALGTNFTAPNDGVIKFKIEPYEITNTTTAMTYTLAGDGALGAGNLNYKSANYKKAIGTAADNKGLVTIASGSSTPGISTYNFVEGTDFDVISGTLKAPVSPATDYKVPVTIRFKGNFTGDVTNKEFVIKPISAGSVSLVFDYPTTLKYTGESRIPKTYVRINGVKYEYKGADTVLPDPNMTAAITYTNDSTPPVGKETTNVGTVTATLALGGLFNDGGKTATYTIAAGDQTDIKDADPIIVNVKSGTTAAIKANLPTYFESKTDPEKKYEITNYTGAAVSVAHTKGTSAVTLAAGSVTGNVYTSGAFSTSNEKNNEYTVTITATVANYGTKTITVKAVVQDAGTETNVASIGVSGRLAFDNRPLSIADVTFGAVTESGATTTYDKINDGHIEIEWYKKNSGTYTLIEANETKNVGTYKAVAKLVGATTNWMTPVESADFTRTALAITSANVESVDVDTTGIVYDGTAKAPKITITLKKVGYDEHVVIDQEHDIAIEKKNSSDTTDYTVAGTNKTYKLTPTGKTGSNYSAFDQVTLPDGKDTFDIEKRPVALNLKDETVTVDSKNEAAVVYADLKDTVSGLIEAHEVADNTKVSIEIQNAWDADGNKITIPENSKLYTKPGKYEFKVSGIEAGAIKTITTPTDVTANYKLDPNRTTGTLTVTPPKMITPTYSVLIDEKTELTEGKTIVYDGAAKKVTAELKNEGIIMAPEYYSVKVTDKTTGEEVAVKNKGDYVLTISSASDVLTFDPIVINFKVDDKPARQVTSISFDSSNLRVKYNDPRMGTTDATLIVTFDEEGETVAAGDIDYSPKLEGSRITVTPGNGGVISFTSTGYGDGSANDTIEYTFWVDGDKTKTATIKVRNMPESTSGEADPGTPAEEPSEYEKPGEDEARGLIDISEFIESATAPKTAPKYTGKPVEPKITVKAKTGYKLVAGTDYKVTYANNINAVTANAAEEEGAIAIVSGIGQYTGSVPVYFSIDRKKLGGTIVAGTIITPEDGDDVADMIAGAISVYDGKLILGYDENGDADYTITPDAAANKGKYGFTVNYTGNYTGSKKGTVRLAADANDIGLAKVTVTFGKDELETATYTGKAITTKTGMNIKAEIEDAETGEMIELTEKTHYTVSYKNNVNAGLGTITLKGKKPYSGTKVVKFPIAADEESELKVEVKSGSKYTGKLLKPAVTVTANGKRLKKGTDYLLYYSAELNAGTKAGKVIVRPIGNYWYEGVEDVKQPFDIEKADFKKTSIKKNSLKKSGIYFNNKALVADEDFTAEVSAPDAKGKYTVTVKVNPESRNFTGGATKTIKGTKDQIDWEQLGYEVDENGDPIPE